MSLFITYVSSTCFEPHRSIFRRVLQAVFADWYVVIRVLLDTSSRYEVTWSINALIKTLCVSCWTAYILQDDTRSLQYQVKCSIFICSLEVRKTVRHNNKGKTTTTAQAWTAQVITHLGCYLCQCSRSNQRQMHYKLSHELSGSKGRNFSTANIKSP